MSLVKLPVLDRPSGISDSPIVLCNLQLSRRTDIIRTNNALADANQLFYIATEMDNAKRNPDA
jgi:hypothetical protein